MVMLSLETIMSATSPSSCQVETVDESNSPEGVNFAGETMEQQQPAQILVFLSVCVSAVCVSAVAGLNLESRR